MQEIASMGNAAFGSRTVTSCSTGRFGEAGRYSGEWAMGIAESALRAIRSKLASIAERGLARKRRVST